MAPATLSLRVGVWRSVSRSRGFAKSGHLDDARCEQPQDASKEMARVTSERDVPAIIKEDHGVRHRRNLIGGNFEQPGGE